MFYDEMSEASAPTAPDIEANPRQQPSGPLLPEPMIADAEMSPEQLVASCRICFEEAHREGYGELIAPCLCISDQKWIHRKCLDDFRVLNERNDAFIQCTTCCFQYCWEPLEEAQHSHCAFCFTPKWELRRRIARDIFLVLFGWAALIALVTAFLFAVGIKPIESAVLVSFVGICVTLGCVALIRGCLKVCGNSQTSGPSVYCWYCPGGDCPDSRSRGNGNESDAVLLFICAVLAVVGLIYAIGLSVFVIGAAAKKHYETYERRIMTRVFVVKDLRNMELNQKREIYERQRPIERMPHIDEKPPQKLYS